MTPTAAEVLASAKALPREERAEVAKELVATLDAHDAELVTETALRDAVRKGTDDLDAGRGINVPRGGLREYLRTRGRLATERAATTAQ